MNNYKPVIGLEIHVELKTKSKMFCQCSADYFGKVANSHTCPVCLGMPGALPVPNKQAIEWALKIGKALNCTINKFSKFDRKHYFYPDLAKGYQISQYDEPFASNGFVKIATKTFHITRVHMEEDTGKLIHKNDETLIDFNRSSVPLVEIVTEPDFDNSDDVKRFLEELQVIIRYLDVSDADMEKGSMRLEPNISLSKLPITNYQLPNYKVEVKNINSFRFVKQAIEYEIERQKEILELGKTPIQETRGFDEKKVITYSQRSKEAAHDYRYFPEPDIPPFTFTTEYIDSIKLPELPNEKLNRYVTELKLKESDAFTISRNIIVAKYFDAIILKLKSAHFAKASRDRQNLEQYIANLIINKKISIDLSVDEFVKSAIAMLAPKETDNVKLEEVIGKIISTNQKSVADYKMGKQNAIMFLVGQVMREMKGQAEAKLVISKLKEKI